MENRLQQTNLRDQALEVLKLRLISGDLAPGQIYSAASLATELGVSNSPVREAMLTLVNQGLMEAVRNRGFRVVPLSEKERRNIYDLRLLVEIPSMARLASLKTKSRPARTSSPRSRRYGPLRQKRRHRWISRCRPALPYRACSSFSKTIT